MISTVFLVWQFGIWQFGIFFATTKFFDIHNANAKESPLIHDYSLPMVALQSFALSREWRFNHRMFSGTWNTMMSADPTDRDWRDFFQLLPDQCTPPENSCAVFFFLRAKELGWLPARSFNQQTLYIVLLARW
jgi:hypothetical protein